MPRLSIIIATYNADKTLERCLSSIASQTFTDYDILIQDGVSTDRTSEVVHSFKQANSYLDIRFEQAQDTGIYDALNKATLRASGEWLYYIGSDDDLYGPNVLQDVFAEISESDNVVYASVQPLGSNREPVPADAYQGRFSMTRLLRGPINHQAIFYRASLVKGIGLYDTRYKVWADWDLTLRCRAQTRLRCLDLIVANYFTGGFSGFNRRDQLFDAELAEKAVKQFGRLNPQIWIWLSSYKAESAYLLRTKSQLACLRVLLTSILIWPFGEFLRHKVCAHIVLTKIGLIRHSKGRE